MSDGPEKSRKIRDSNAKRPSPKPKYELPPPSMGRRAIDAQAYRAKNQAQDRRLQKIQGKSPGVPKTKDFRQKGQLKQEFSQAKQKTQAKQAFNAKSVAQKKAEQNRRLQVMKQKAAASKVQGKAKNDFSKANQKGKAKEAFTRAR